MNKLKKCSKCKKYTMKEKCCEKILDANYKFIKTKKMSDLSED
jgi:hypothetical protein